MVNNTISKISENYLQYTDKYFLRTRQILEAKGINPTVRYQVFARNGGEIKGLNDAVKFVKTVAGNRAQIYALKDGEFYTPGEPLMKIEGRVQDLVELETVYLGLISGGLTGDIDMNTVRQRARDIKSAAKDKKLIYFGARHFHPSLDSEISRICMEEGFDGCSTDIGAKAWSSFGNGTTPHALIVSYAVYMEQNGITGNPTVESAKGFDEVVDKKVPRIMLIDTFNQETRDTIETARAIPNLRGVRIDTCGENFINAFPEVCSRHVVKAPYEVFNLNIDKKYFGGTGVKVFGVWNLKENLHYNSLDNLELVLSSGFNAEKTRAFVKADEKFNEIYNVPMFTTIGTGSIANPVMATADIVAYYDEKTETWKEKHKVGRPEILTNRLREV